MDNKKFSFEKLEVYTESRKLVREVYQLVKQLPSEERFALGAQIRRAAVSITANIAEGCGRFSMKEKIYFIGIAYGSLMEVFSELQTALDLEYIAESSLEELRPQFIHVAKMLSGLRNSYSSTLLPAPSKPSPINPQPTPSTINPKL